MAVIGHADTPFRTQPCPVTALQWHRQVGLAVHHLVAQQVGQDPSALFQEVAARLPDGPVADLLRNSEPATTSPPKPSDGRSYRPPTEQTSSQRQRAPPVNDK